MGAWGTAIFSDDFACDIRDDYIKLIIKGKSSEEATEIIKESMMPESGDDEYPVFWIALAVTQWKKGRLLPEVRDMAIALIESGADLIRWEEEPPKQYKKREAALEKAKQTLLSPMPPAKKIPVPSWMKSDPWQKGDVLSYKITREDISHPEYCGKYILLRVEDMVFYKINETYSAYYAVFAWYGDEIPNPAIVDKLTYLKLREVKAGTPDYFYLISCYVSIDKRDIKEHDIRVLMSDPAFNSNDSELLKNGRKDNGLLGPGYFDDLVADLLHSNQKTSL